MAHLYKATVTWVHDGSEFAKGRYSRGHSWAFDGGITVPASSSPAVVPLPMSRADAIDPEEAFVASLSSCHMLTFLFLAGKKGFSVNSYVDEAVGEMSKNAKGKFFVSKVTLNPTIEWAGATPDAAQLADLHHHAHEECFIANSVLTEVVVA